MDDLALFEEDDGGDGVDGELHRGVAVGVGIDFTYLDLAFVFFGEFVDGGCEHAAGATPFSPEIDEDGGIGIEDFGIEVGIGELNDIGAGHDGS